MLVALPLGASRQATTRAEVGIAREETAAALTPLRGPWKHRRFSTQRREGCRSFHES